MKPEHKPTTTKTHDNRASATQGTRVTTVLATLVIAMLFSNATAHAQTDATTPPLPTVHQRDVKTYAYLWDGGEWRLLPRNEARIFDGSGHDGLPSNGKKQLVGTLLLDGCYAVPAASGENVILAYRGKFKTFKGLPSDESGFEVTRLDVKPGVKKDTLIRTAKLQRLGESAATFADKRESITVQKIESAGGFFHVIRITAPLSSGRYALYLPDRAFEFQIR